MRKFFKRLFNVGPTPRQPPLPSNPMDETGLDSDAIEAVITAIDVDIAIACHESWKLCLENVLDGKSSDILNPEVLGLDNRCELGQWLYGPGQQRLGQHPAFPVLIARHKYFHLQASSVAALAQSGNIDQARQIFNTSYQQASSQVVLLLKQLKSCQ